MTIELNVNGRRLSLELPGDTLLIDVLRDRLDLVGTKRSCGEGLCGSCTVLIDGKPKTACKIKLGNVSGREITTIEGLGSTADPHPIQAAFAESGAIQCGYCTPGMILVTKALLDQNPEPGTDEIIHALRGNICRCTGYAKIIDAVRLAAQYLKTNTVQKPRIIDPEILRKATGQALYTDDLRLPGMLHAKVLHSKIAHGEIVRIDVQPARLRPGVRGVFTINDVPGKKYIGRRFQDQPVFADKHIRYLGEPIAVVVAETAEAAEKALDDIRIEVKPLEPILTPQGAIAPGALPLHPKGNICWAQDVSRGDTQAAFQQAAAVVEDSYETPFNEHLYMETDSGLAKWDDEGRLQLFIATQEIHEIRKLVAASLGLVEDKVRVIQTATGGAFGGRKICPFPVIVALAAYYLKAPVRLTYTRRETFLDSTKRHPFTMHYRVAADKSGKISALQADITADTGAYASYGPPVLGRALAHAASIYEIPNVAIKGRMVYTNNPIAGAMRGFGATQVHFAMECMLDRLAQALSLDPVEFRRRNMLRPGSYTITGERLGSDIQVPVVMETAAEAVNAARKRIHQTKDSGGSESDWKHGIGMACHWFGMGTTKPHDASEIYIGLSAEGIVEIGAGVADLGQGSTATLWTLAAETLGIPHESIRITHNDTALTADSGPSNASRQTYFSGSALIDGLDKLIKALTPSASKLLEMPPEKIQFNQGAFFSPDYPEYRISLNRLAAVCKQENTLPKVTGRFEAKTIPMDPATGEGCPYEKYISGAHVAEVEVNSRTGELRINCITSIHDIGKVVSRKRVEGQVEGCVAMAIGFTLIEEFKPGRTDSLKNYPVPRSHDIPEVRSILIEDAATTTFRAKGIGESGLLSVAPAIINALADATGIHLTRLPATAKKIRTAVLSHTVRLEKIHR